MRGFTIIALGALLAGCGEAKKAFDEGFDEAFDKSFHEKFISSCTSSAMRSGATQDLASKLCTCASDKVKERFSVREKMNLTEEQAMPIVEECSASVIG